MRFFAHVGATFHGPSSVEDLVRLPGFDGNTLVCPVGSENSDDWKSALSYPPFREALLALSSVPLRCPRCSHVNPSGSRYCNECAALIEGIVPDLPPPNPEPATLSAEHEFSAPKETVMPANHEPPLLTPDDGILLAPEPIAPGSTSSAAVAGSSRVLWLAAGVAAAGAALGYWLWLRAPAKVPVSEQLTTPTAAPVAAPASKPAVAADTATAVAPAEPFPVIAKPEPVVSSPLPKEEAPVKAPSRRRDPSRKGKRRAKRVQAPTPEPTPAPVPEEKDPVPAEPADAGFMLPGVPRRIPVKSIVKRQNNVAASTAAKAGEEPTPTDDPTTRQVREQFEFCSQLLVQGAFEDHFDTCLCPDARQAAPYLGRKSAYAAALKKLASAGKLETSAKISGIALDDASAKVTAKWKSDPLKKGRQTTETWRLDDGLWCRQP